FPYGRARLLLTTACVDFDTGFRRFPLFRRKSACTMKKLHFFAVPEGVIEQTSLGARDMASTLTGTALRQFLYRLACGPSGELPDGELLAQFHANQDEDAFAALVRRHGPMVVGVCQRVLAHVQDVEDAFQATFLILARKAASLDQSRSLGNWL